MWLCRHWVVGLLFVPLELSSERGVAMTALCSGHAFLAFLVLFYCWRLFFHLYLADLNLAMLALTSVPLDVCPTL